MDVGVRPETLDDRLAVAEVIQAAFRTVAVSDHREHLLVERLRGSDAFVPDLSLVAETAGTIVGHVLLTRITIEGRQGSSVSLALAPLSVAPHCQRRGIGGELIVEAHSRAKRLGFRSVVVLGHPGYYPRFGYQLTTAHGISMPFNTDERNCMVASLTSDGLSGVSGRVVYPPEFGL